MEGFFPIETISPYTQDGRHWQLQADSSIVTTGYSQQITSNSIAHHASLICALATSEREVDQRIEG